MYVVRGLVGGRQRFTGYAATLGAEGVARILPCVVLAVSGMPDAVGYAVAFAAGSAFGALAGLPWLRGPGRRSDRQLDGPAGSAGRMARALSYLVGGTC